MSPSLSSSLGVHIPRGLGGLATVTKDEITRVEGDGGTVADPEWMDEHIRKLQSLGWYSFLPWFGDPASAVKKDGAGEVETLYNISENNIDALQATATDQPDHLFTFPAGDPGLNFDGNDFLRCPDDVSLDSGDIKLFVCGLFRFNVLSGTPISKWRSGQREWLMAYSTSANAFRWATNEDGSASIRKVDYSLAAATNTWYFFYGQHDPDSNNIKFSINGGARESTSSFGGIYSGFANVILGATDDDSRHFDGQMGPTILGHGYLPSVSEVNEYENFLRTHFGI